MEQKLETNKLLRKKKMYLEIAVKILSFKRQTLVETSQETTEVIPNSGS